MDRPIVLKGVIHGKTITLDEKTFLPDGYPVTLHLVFTPEEALRVTAGAWADAPPELWAEFEDILSEFHGRRISLRDEDEG